MMKKVVLISAILFQSIGLNAQWTDQNSSTTQDLNDVFFVDENTGWAVGRNGAVVHTTNGGTSWAAQNSATSKDLNGVYFVSASKGFAVGDNGTVIRYDNGTWTALSSGTTRDLFGVYFLDESTGWISGDWGQIRKTDNAGDSWNEQNNHAKFPNLFHRLYMVDENTGWAVGTSGKILKYNGTTWEGQTSGITTDLYGVYFQDASFGLAVGKSQKILVCNNGNWSEHNSGLNSHTIYKVHIVNQNLAYAACAATFGGAGVILKYNGSVWSIDYEYSGMGTEIFYGIHFPSSNVGYAVGAGGMIKKKGNSTPSGSAEVPAVLVSEIAPNPFSSVVRVSVVLPESANFTLRLYDIKGMEIPGTAMHTHLLGGRNELELDGSFLQAGVYFLRMEYQGRVETVKIVKAE